MPTFEDKQGRKWSVELDPLLIEDVKSQHQINLVDLEKDPVGALRFDPMKLVAVIALVCQEQVDKLGLSPKDFARCLPFPPDPMLNALEDAIVGFFPTGRASHVREVLASFQALAGQMDQLARTKMEAAMRNPRVMSAIDKQADVMLEKAIAEVMSNPGTQSTETSTSSM